LEANPLAAIEGCRLSSVEFVQDYVQLRFDGPVLTAMAPVRVWTDGLCFEWGKQGYRDALCDRIGKSVRRAFSIPVQEIRIEFEDESEFSISLKSEGRGEAEFAIFSNPPGPLCVW
jgi:hypothetical protein